MNRVKYPNSKVMHQEIETILNKSGMFNETEEKDNSYVVFKPVRTKKSTLYTTVSICVAAAALVFIIVKAGSASLFLTQKPFSPQSSVDQEEKQIGTSIPVNNDCKVSLESSSITIKSQLNNNQKIKLDYAIPAVYVNDKRISVIDDFYNSLLQDIQSRVYNEYNNYSSEYFGHYKTEPVSAKYNCSISPYSTENEQNIISFHETFTNETDSDEGNKAEKETTGHSFDYSTGAQIHLEDLFTDKELGMSELKEQLTSAIEQATTQQSIKEKGVKVNSLSVEDVLQDGNWYFGDNGIAICCNGLYEKYADVVGDKHYSYISGDVIVIPYSDLPSMKEKYIIN